MKLYTIQHDGKIFANFTRLELVQAGIAEQVIDADDIADFKTEIDVAAEKTYAVASRFGDEYKAKAAAALAFKDAGYKGTPANQVSDFAVAAGLSVEDAANVILAQSDQFNAALNEVSRLRMQKFTLGSLSVVAAQVKTADLCAQIAMIGSQL
ncbi:hypothetical protein DTO96_102385 [Ephemeroptericola cinctiostellae]|uniref:Uncharacterized protein n=1 Tax=Ephemeroptericola cinctiostellae TaxID=2268024 RepID=A0A345DE42_9BURK|nr:hypothetical protein [Ephemeroptericola cinctiostellae]AXF86630.1 hypothetical protein DTO96_102385 [Ephemeroptericola cinctiostellae]